jgi:hypothetical protein
VRTHYKHENEAALDFQSIGANFCHSAEQSSNQQAGGNGKN